MISHESNPVEWAILMYELEDAKEHLSNLIAELHPNSSPNEIDEIDFKIQIGHIYSHLNRVSNSRNHIGEISIEEFIEYSQFPNDIAPI